MNLHQLLLLVWPKLNSTQFVHFALRLLRTFAHHANLQQLPEMVIFLKFVENAFTLKRDNVI